MDQDQPPPPSTRKYKFAPKPPPRRTPIPTVPQTEAEDEVYTSGSAKKASIIFWRNGKCDETVDVAKFLLEASLSAHSGSVPGDTDKGRVTLPLKEPHYGDKEILTEAEFGDAARNLEYDEDTINPALELGLLEENDKQQLLFLQIPGKLPQFKQSASAFGKKSKGASAGAKGKGTAAGASAAAQGEETVGGSEPLTPENAPKMSCGLEDLPAGHMGKMLVYKSGAIKWKLGDTLFDVSPGSNNSLDVVAINTADKNCCMLGQLGKPAVVTPDIDSILDH